MSSAAAENCTGEVTVAPAAGEQIFTVRSTVEVHGPEPPELTITVADEVADWPDELVAVAVYVVVAAGVTVTLPPADESV